MKTQNASKLALALATAWAGAMLATAHAAPPDGHGHGGGDEPPKADFVPGELLVKFTDDARNAAVSSVRNRIGAQQLKSFPAIGAALWRLAEGVSVEHGIGLLAAPAFADSIEYAEPNYILHKDDVPDDPLLIDLWGLHNIGQTGGILDADIDAPEAWDVQTGSGTVVVAVIDTGIDYAHEDLAANIWVNTGEIQNGLDDDDNGFVDDVIGWDFVNEDNDPFDDHDHGTHTAGTVGAVGGNGIGVTGVNWTVTLMPLKFLDSSGNGTTDDAIDAILYAASFEDGLGNKVVRITNNSWGGGRRSNALKQAIEASGALFVAAAGNGGSTKKHFPAAFDLDNIISVAATDDEDGLAGFSNHSTSWVDVGAPGVAILSTTPNDSYGLKNGTSMAAPHVSGVAALLMAEFPGWSNEDIKAQILGMVDPLPSLEGETLAGGRVNAAAALTGSPPPPPPPDSIPPAPVTDLAVDIAATTFDSITLNWTATGDDGTNGTATLYDVRYMIESLNFTPSNSLIVFDEMNGQGDWTISISDDAGPDDGTLNGWGIHISSASGLTVHEVGGLGIPIPSPGEVSHLINVSDIGTILDVNVFVDISHTYLGDLTVTLEHGGTVVMIVDAMAGGQCNANNYAGIILDDEGDAGAIDAECVSGLSSVRLPQGEPFPQPSGSPEAFTVTDLSSDTTYLLALDVADEAGNRSGFSNVVTETTLSPPPSAWTVEIVDSGGTYLGLDFHPIDGLPGIAYSANSNVKFARFNGLFWEIDIVDSSQYAGIDFAYDPLTGEPTISYGWGKLKFARFDGASWDIDVVESGRARNDVTSLVYDDMWYPSISYSKAGVLKLARFNGSSWQKEIVDPDAGARYSGLAFDSTGNPAIAYSDDLSGNGSIDTLKFAHFNGSSWDIEVVDTGPTGYGVFAALAYDPITRHPAMLHHGDSTARFVRWDGTAWVIEPLDETVNYVSGCALAFGPDGTTYAAWAGDGQLKVAIRDTAGTWEIETVDAAAFPFHLSLKLDPWGVPSVCYGGSGGVRFARRDNP